MQPDMEHQGGSRDVSPLTPKTLSLTALPRRSRHSYRNYDGSTMKKLLLSADIYVYEKQEQGDCYRCADYGRRIGRIINCCCGCVFCRTLGRTLLVCRGVKSCLGFLGLAILTSIACNSPLDGFKPDNLSGVGKSLPTHRDFKGVEVEVEPGDNGVERCECAVRCSRSDGVGIYECFALYLLVGAARDKECQHKAKGGYLAHRSGSVCTLKLGQALLANSLCPWTVAPGNFARSSATSLMSADLCASVRVSLGVLPSLAQPPM